MSAVKAMVVNSLGGPLELETLPLAPPESDEICLKIRACGLNFADLLQIKGQYQERIAPPFVPGMEVCGTVEVVGAAVKDFNIGQRVVCVPGHGGLATHLNVAESACTPVPDALSDAQAAGFQIAYGTSHLALARRARLQKGETVVVLGAAGGVGGAGS